VEVDFFSDPFRDAALRDGLVENVADFSRDFFVQNRGHQLEGVGTGQHAGHDLREEGIDLSLNFRGHFCSNKIEQEIVIEGLTQILIMISYTIMSTNKVHWSIQQSDNF